MTMMSADSESTEPAADAVFDDRANAKRDRDVRKAYVDFHENFQEQIVWNRILALWFRELIRSPADKNHGGGGGIRTPA